MLHVDYCYRNSYHLCLESKEQGCGNADDTVREKMILNESVNVKNRDFMSRNGELIYAWCKEHRIRHDYV